MAFAGASASSEREAYYSCAQVSIGSTVLAPTVGSVPLKFLRERLYSQAASDRTFSAPCHDGDKQNLR